MHLDQIPARSDINGPFNYRSAANLKRNRFDNAMLCQHRCLAACMRCRRIRREARVDGRGNGNVMISVSQRLLI